MEEETVIIEEEKESSFTFRNIGKAIAKYKWWIIGATAVGALSGYLGFKFGINQNREVYASSFSYDINAKAKTVVSEEKMTAKERASQKEYLADGSLFSFSDIISESRLKAVQADNQEQFASINVSKMAQNGGISITQSTYTDSTTGEEIPDYPAKYKLSVSFKYFKNKQQAKVFINALISYQLKVAETANNNYEVENFLNDSTVNYGLFVNNLNKQYAAIKECYTDLLEEFATSSIADKDGSTLTSVNNKFMASYDNGAAIDQLEGVLYTNHLVDYTKVDEASLKSQAESYKQSIRGNLLDIERYQQSIQDLTSTAIIDNGSSALTTEIIQLNKKVLEIKEVNAFYTKEIKNLGYTVNNDVITLDNINSVVYDAGNKGVIQSWIAGEQSWKDQCDAFKLSLVETSSRLKNDRLTAGDVYGFVNNKYNNQVSFYTPGVAKLESHLSNFIGVGAGLVLGFVLSTLICTFVYIAKKDKEEQAQAEEEAK